ncbi:hypothetical protein V5O48_012565 [Marasmius crinis-equi]|uniref:Uncharacterized protein n=1 Tax=Marasmius crinis-equi TaxID=585013 RepID=A0ABR3F2S1_9AGAR
MSLNASPDKDHGGFPSTPPSLSAAPRRLQHIFAAQHGINIQPEVATPWAQPVYAQRCSEPLLGYDGDNGNPPVGIGSNIPYPQNLFIAVAHDSLTLRDIPTHGDYDGLTPNATNDILDSANGLSVYNNTCNLPTGIGVNIPYPRDSFTAVPHKRESDAMVCEAHPSLLIRTPSSRLPGIPAYDDDYGGLTPNATNNIFDPVSSPHVYDNNRNLPIGIGSNIPYPQSSFTAAPHNSSTLPGIPAHGDYGGPTPNAMSNLPNFMNGLPVDDNNRNSPMGIGDNIPHPRDPFIAAPHNRSILPSGNSGGLAMDMALQHRFDSSSHDLLNTAPIAPTYDPPIDMNPQRQASFSPTRNEPYQPGIISSALEHSGVAAFGIGHGGGSSTYTSVVFKLLVALFTDVSSIAVTLPSRCLDSLEAAWTIPRSSDVLCSRMTSIMKSVKALHHRHTSLPALFETVLPRPALSRSRTVPSGLFAEPSPLENVAQTLPATSAKFQAASQMVSRRGVA